MARRRRSHITPAKVAIALAVLTTIFAMIASALNAISDGDPFEVGLHQFAMILMLAAYSFLILVIMSSRKKKIASLQVMDENELLSISPCVRSEVVVLDQSSIDAGTKGPLSKIPYASRFAMRVAVARSLKVDESSIEALLLFPNLAILDLQDATVDRGFWDALEDLSSLDHVLANGAIDIALLKKISISIPEVKFWLEPKKLAIGSLVGTKPPPLAAIESN
jgi:hypothetical protein